VSEPTKLEDVMSVGLLAAVEAHRHISIHHYLRWIPPLLGRTISFNLKETPEEGDHPSTKRVEVVFESSREGSRPISCVCVLSCDNKNDRLLPGEVHLVFNQREFRTTFNMSSGPNGSILMPSSTELYPVVANSA